jgi:GrpB-like predicted nucleotidyltransferase (UPF0157 family)
MSALHPYAIEWPVVFQYEEYLLRRAIDIPNLAIEHIGSTAVPALFANPIIDIMIGIPIEYPLDKVMEPMSQLGYVNIRNDDKTFSEQRFFVRIENEKEINCNMILNKDNLTFLDQMRQTHHVHVVYRQSSFWKDSLRVRDHLRFNIDDKRVYEIIKKHLTESAPAKVSHYEKVQIDFINGILWR